MALPPPTESSVALVTGASSGIGEEIARDLAARGYSLALAARREDRLRELAAELEQAHGTVSEVIPADLEGTEGRDALVAAIERAGKQVTVLVNNAGFGGAADFVEADREKLLRMVRLNCEALTDMQARYLPRMVDAGAGAVINIASTASFQPIPGTGVYAATKAFVLSLSRGDPRRARRDGRDRHRRVPRAGPYRVPRGCGHPERRGHAPPTSSGSRPTQVAKAAVDGAAKGKRVVVPGLLNRAGALSGQHAPRSLDPAARQARLAPGDVAPASSAFRPARRRAPRSAETASSGTDASSTSGAASTVTTQSTAKLTRPRAVDGRSRPARTSRAKFGWKVSPLTRVCHIQPWVRPQREQRTSRSSPPVCSASRSSDRGECSSRPGRMSIAVQPSPPIVACTDARLAATSATEPSPSVVSSPRASASRSTGPSACSTPTPQVSQRSSTRARPAAAAASTSTGRPTVAPVEGSGRVSQP